MTWTGMIFLILDMKYFQMNFIQTLFFMIFSNLENLFNLRNIIKFNLFKEFICIIIIKRFVWYNLEMVNSFMIKMERIY